MPGRYLLIEFEDEESADKLRDQIEAATRKGKKYRVLGLFARPGKSCICVLPHDTRTKDRFVRGGRFGWWLCTKCKRPRLGDHQLKNLLAPPDVIEPAAFEGVDNMSTSMEPQQFIRYPLSLSIVTYPEAIASAARD